jgi:hypothetical protein
MTAAADSIPLRQLPRPAPRRFSWEMLAAAIAALTASATAVWGLASTNQRVTNLEQQIPPGAIQRLDERTLQMQAEMKGLQTSLTHLEDRAGSR